MYALRLCVRSMHNRVGAAVTSIGIGRSEVIAIVPIVAVILVLALYPQFGLRRSEQSRRGSIAAAELQQHNAGGLAVRVSQAP